MLKNILASSGLLILLAQAAKESIRAGKLRIEGISNFSTGTAQQWILQDAGNAGQAIECLEMQLEVLKKSLSEMPEDGTDTQPSGTEEQDPDQPTNAPAAADDNQKKAAQKKTTRKKDS